MSKDFPHEKWVKSNSSSQVQVEPEEEEEEEALSLCDLPINKANQSPKEQVHPTQSHAEFDFGFGSGSSSGLGQMCAADEVFFRGQILPFRHSVSSESSLNGLLNPTRPMSRSESMDHSYSGGFRSIPNSRSSSIKSQYSSSSGSSTGYKPRVRNQFHSHPSPSPQIRSRSTRQGHRNPKSTIWGFFQTGLVRAPEFGLWSIRGNNNINKSFGSRNSNSSSCSSSSVSNGKKIERKKKKLRRLFDINGALFGGCKCSVLNAVEVVPSKIFIVKEGEEEEEEEKEGKQKRKQAVSRNRTFEWLKQLSLEGTADGA